MRTLPLLWYLYDLLLDQFGKQMVIPIIRTEKLELIAEAMGGGLPVTFQALIIAGTRMMTTLLLI